MADHLVEGGLVPARILASLHRRDGGDGHPALQGVFLVDEADPFAIRGCQPPAVAPEDACFARGRGKEAQQDAEQCRLARAVRANDGVDVAALDRQVQVIYGDLLPVALGRATSLDHIPRVRCLVHGRSSGGYQADFFASTPNALSRRAMARSGG